MAAIAKGLVFGMPAAAQRNNRPSRQAECLAGRIANLELPLNADGAIGYTGDFRGRHDFDGTALMRLALLNAKRLMRNGARQRNRPPCHRHPTGSAIRRKRGYRSD